MPIAQFSGLASGIDSASLIDALIEAKLSVNEKRKSEVEFLKSESTALDDINEKLLSLEALIDPFRTANGGGVSKQATSTDSTVATAVVGSSATNASYSIDVISIANTGTASFDESYSGLSDFASTAGTGTLSITIGTGANQVTVSATVTQNVTTIDDLVTALNSDTDADGRFAASAVNVGTDSSPDYRIVLSSLRSGTDFGQIGITADPSLTELQGGVTTIEQATDAVFHVDGIAGNITRSSNSVSDVLSGVTLQLSKAGSTVISIGNDAQETADKVSEIVTAFNDIVAYIKENNTVTQNANSSDRTNVFGTLAKTRLDDDFISQFRLDLSGAASANGTVATSIAEIGISTNRDGTLSFDEEDFLDAVADDPLGVTEVMNDFADTTSGVGGMIYQYTRFQGLVDIAQTSNQNQIDNLNRSIESLERQTDKIRTSLTQRFARLESISAQLQSQQSALTSALSSLG